MSQASAGRSQRAIGALQIAILVLIAITAIVHLQRGIGMSLGGFGGGPGRFPAGGAPGGFPPGGPGGAPGGFNIFRLLPLPLPTLFLLNGIGYIVLGTALYLPALARFRPLVRWLLIAFATVTFVLYFLFNGFRLNPIAIVDKIAELTLIGLLLLDARRSSQPAATEAALT
jgi:hypothetical protein